MYTSYKENALMRASVIQDLTSVQDSQTMYFIEENWSWYILKITIVQVKKSLSQEIRLSKKFCIVEIW